MKRGAAALAAATAFSASSAEAAWAGDDSTVNRSTLSGGDALKAASNLAFRLELRAEGGHVQAGLHARLPHFRAAGGDYLYRAVREGKEYRGLANATIHGRRRRLMVRGQLAGLDLEHHFFLPRNKPWMEERIVLRNPSGSRVALSDFEAGFQRRASDSRGDILGELSQDRWVAVPLRQRADDPNGFANDFSIDEMFSHPGYEPIMDASQRCNRAPSPHRRSEGWAWTHGDWVLGIFVFNQENMLFSVVSTEQQPEGKTLRFGGACMMSGEPAALGRIEAGQSVDLGVVRYETRKGGFLEAEYAFRAMLDAKGCRFPPDYNPPV
ncbi:MAG: hypothetical protein KGR98_15465, partial [Verrucomicrobia bacterium]|nr:hypothetical protein [Verrucomicrobiota bacterium]